MSEAAPTAVGVDARRGGWFAVVLRGRTVEGVRVRHLAELPARIPDAAAFAVDMPLTLPDRAPRAADLAAKALLGSKHVSVFLVPPREVLEQPTHAEASARSRELMDRGLSAQAYALRTKCLEAIAWAERTAPDAAPVHEVHPEVSFTVLRGEPAASKRTWLGQQQRVEALRSAGIVVPPDDPEAAGVAVDDVLDAAIAAWSCRRILAGEAIGLPEDPERFRDTELPSVILA